jgi:hypothetical protein
MELIMNINGSNIAHEKEKEKESDKRSDSDKRNHSEKNKPNRDKK